MQYVSAGNQDLQGSALTHGCVLPTSSAGDSDAEEQAPRQENQAPQAEGQLVVSLLLLMSLLVLRIPYARLTGNHRHLAAAPCHFLVSHPKGLTSDLGWAT
jgi:hypothetical protein